MVLKFPIKTRADTQINSEGIWQSVEDLYKFKPDYKILAQRRGSEHKIPLLAKKLFAPDGFWERER